MPSSTMPNWLYLITNVFHLLALAIWIGGGLALGAIVAPVMFRKLPRLEAGALFGAMLRRFARLRLAAVVVAILTAAVKHLAWETHAVSVWMVLRWLALGVMAASVAYEILHLEDAIEAARAPLGPDLSESDPLRVAFQRLHRRAENLMKLSLLAAVLALFLS